MAQLENLRVEFISLVARPANRRGILLKGVHPGREFPLVRADVRLQRVYGIVYAPDDPDTEGDWADAGTIRRAADDWMRAGRAAQVDQEHDFTPTTAYVAESWLVRAGDALFPAEREGAWAVGIQVTDPALWARIEAGEAQGLSLAGQARRTAAARGFVHKLRETFWGDDPSPAHPNGDTDMTDEQVRALVRETLTELRKGDAQQALTQQVATLTEQVTALQAGLTGLTKAEATAALTTQLADLAGRLKTLEEASLPPLGAGTADPAGVGLNATWGMM